MGDSTQYLMLLLFSVDRICPGSNVVLSQRLEALGRSNAPRPRAQPGLGPVALQRWPRLPFPTRQVPAPCKRPLRFPAPASLGCRGSRLAPGKPSGREGCLDPGGVLRWWGPELGDTERWEGWCREPRMDGARRRCTGHLQGGLLAALVAGAAGASPWEAGAGQPAAKFCDGQLRIKSN